MGDYVGWLCIYLIIIVVDFIYLFEIIVIEKNLVGKMIHERSGNRI